MKRVLVALAAVALLVVGTAAAALAQTPTPPNNQDQPGWGCFGAGGNGNYDPSQNPTVKRLADKLGMSAADLASALQGGKSVADVAADKKVDLQTLVDTLLAPQKEMMQIRVKYGYLTQDQADSMLKFMSDGMKTQFQQKGFFGGGMMGPGMMGGGMMGPGFSGGPEMMGRGFGPGMMGRGFGPQGGFGPRWQAPQQN